MFIIHKHYCIHIKDGCYDTTIQRCFTAKRPLPGIASVGVISPYCNSFDVTVVGETGTPAAKYCLYDDKGNLVTCDSAGIFKGIIHGNYCIKAISLCGDTTAPYCFYTQAPKPTVGDTVIISNHTCKTFTATIGGTSNLTSPQYCLYDSNNNLVSCDTTGIFDNIPYGSYCIKVKDGCYDTTITRCFSASHPVVVISAVLSQSNKTCTDFTLNVTGTNLTAPWYSLYTSSGQPVDSNSTGVFDHLAYGNYCLNIKDGCEDTTLHICQDFTKVKGITLATYKTCTIGDGVVSAQVKSRNNPYTFTFYHPDGHVVYTQTTWSDYVSTELPALPSGARYKIVVVDNCGQEDIGYIAPDATIVERNIVVTNKCPSAIWQDGSGDVNVTYNSNLFDLKPLLISKDGSSIAQSYTNTNGYDSYIFSDLGPGTYVMESTMEACNSKVYDTFQVKPYTFPKQVQSAIYQCNNNSFTLSGNVEGGVGPYSYQIIGSQPASPDITTGVQSSPLFTINNGTTYSLIRLRSVDACGNAALSDVSVLPLQNIVIKANTTCFYQNVVLSVDTIPNASYQWFKRSNNSGDSSLISTGLTYSIPFMEDSNIGTYVCVVSVNTDCLTRMSSFTLSGQCDDHPLPVGIQLKGIKTKEGNELNWSLTKEAVKYFIIERSSGKDKVFTEIGKVNAESSLLEYSFLDGMPLGGNNYYRLKIIDQHENTSYSNVVTLKNITFHSMIYPNPITKSFYLTLSSNKTCNYRLELFNMAGQKIFTQKLPNVINGTFNFRRPLVTNGNYFLNVVNETTGESEGFKIAFE